jgi:hypothetical protein
MPALEAEILQQSRFRDEVFLWNAPFDAATTLVKNTTTLLGYHLGK